METIIYIRTSTEEQNPENQLKDCLKINSYGEYKLIEDKESAWKDDKKRLGFLELIKLIKTNKIKHLIVWDFDRIYRNRLKFKEFLLFLKAYKVKLHSFRQEWFENLHKIPEPWNEIVYDLMINIYGYIAEDESKKKSQRIKIAVRKKCPKCEKINTQEVCEKCGYNLKRVKSISYKGNKWGRRKLNKKVWNQVIKLYNEGKNYNEICKSVFYWDKSNNKKFISKGMVSKIINKNR